jgi:hypothetical protein
MRGVGERLRLWRGDAQRFVGDGPLWRLIGGLLLLYLLLALVVGMFWSAEPDQFDVRAEAERAAGGGQAVVPGSVTATALIRVGETLLDKRGGFLSNDIFPPGLWLDNMPAWEYGVVLQVRDLARALRESISRSQSQSEEDDDLARAEPRFNFSTNSWAVPATESEYRDAVKYLQRYRTRLTAEGKGKAHFYTRADNLNLWLGSISSRLGNLSQRLSASVGQRRVDADARTEEGVASGDIAVKTSWRKIDDVFFEARGTTWALLHFLRAVEIDFGDVLKKKNAEVSLRQIIRELEETQQTLYSPLILNGSGFGMLANHSLVMANYISRANAAIIDLRDLLSQG